MFHLEKKSNNKMYIWRARITHVNDRDTSDQSQVKLEWEWGAETGKMQHRERIYTSGKQNRTPMEQALLECKKMVKDKKNGGYTEVSSNNNNEMVDEKGEGECNVSTGCKELYIYGQW